LVDVYVRRSFAQPDLAYVYYAEHNNVPAANRVAIQNIQRSIIESWVRQVVAARPSMEAGEARFAVHAAFGLVVDLGRLMQNERKEPSQAVVSHLMQRTLLGDHH
jgi:hypothetical protein